MTAAGCRLDAKVEGEGFREDAQLGARAFRLIEARYRGPMTVVNDRSVGFALVAPAVSSRERRCNRCRALVVSV
jgi:hypothetical protein